MLIINSTPIHQNFFPLPNSHKKSSYSAIFQSSLPRTPNLLKIAPQFARKRGNFVVGAVTEDSKDAKVIAIERRDDELRDTDGSKNSDPSSSFSSDSDVNRLIGRGINAGIVLAAGTFAITKLLTIDHDYWQGWTLYEIVRYAPEHNWIAYEQALETNPVLAKMVISGIVYFLGDWIAQCVEGKPLFEFDRTRMFRSGLVGFTLHGSLSHYYYHICEALFPFQGWWVVPVKIAFDQTVWSAIWNSIYFTLLGILRRESPANIVQELKNTFWPMLTAGWKLWPFAHLITYGVIPVEQRLLWVDCVELIWVTILSTLRQGFQTRQQKKIPQRKRDLDDVESPHISPSTPPHYVLVAHVKLSIKSSLRIDSWVGRDWNLIPGVRHREVVSTGNVLPVKANPGITVTRNDIRDGSEGAT
ncbi:hypothetical protein V2J09_006472 [Rumex salicifolius]